MIGSAIYQGFIVVDWDWIQGGTKWTRFALRGCYSDGKRDSMMVRRWVGNKKIRWRRASCD